MKDESQYLQGKSSVADKNERGGLLGMDELNRSSVRTGTPGGDKGARYSIDEVLSSTP